MRRHAPHAPVSKDMKDRGGGGIEVDIKNAP